MRVHLKYGRRWWLAVAVAAGIVMFGGYLAVSRTGVLAQGLLPTAGS
jgi:hypothetical protein